MFDVVLSGIGSEFAYVTGVGHGEHADSQDTSYADRYAKGRSNRLGFVTNDERVSG
jgi:hypothetical protein